MKTRKILGILVLALGQITCQAKVSEAAPMGTAFTYQGRLLDANQPADGLYDFQFSLYDDSNSTRPLVFPVAINDVDVIDGYFTVELDFGSKIFNGDARWLEIDVRPGAKTDPGAFVKLRPRQEILPSPYAILSATAQTALSVENSSITTPKLATDAVTSDKVEDGQITGEDIRDLTITSADLAMKTVHGSRIEDGGISTENIADGAVTSVKLAANSVKSLQILNSTITTDDIAGQTITSANVNPLGGVYSSKESLYVVAQVGTIPDHVCGTFTARCADENDLPLFGYGSPNWNNEVRISDQQVKNWDNPSAVAEFSIRWCNDGPSAKEVTTCIICLAVD